MKANLFPKGEGNVFVFDHVYYLSPHSENEEHHPVEEKYRPEHRYIKCTEERHNKSNAKCLRDRVPSTQNHKIKTKFYNTRLTKSNL